MREVISHADNSTPLNFGMKPLRAFRQLARFFRHPKRAHQKGVRQRPRPHVIRMQKLVLGDIKSLDALVRFSDGLQDLLGAEAV